MALQNRVEKLETKAGLGNELLNIIIIKPYSDTPLPEPNTSGGIKVSYRYADKPED